MQRQSSSANTAAITSFCPGRNDSRPNVAKCDSSCSTSVRSVIEIHPLRLPRAARVVCIVERPPAISNVRPFFGVPKWISPEILLRRGLWNAATWRRFPMNNRPGGRLTQFAQIAAKNVLRPFFMRRSGFRQKSRATERTLECGSFVPLSLE